MSPSRQRRNAKRMSEFISAKLAEIQLEKEKNNPFRLAGNNQTVFHRKSTPDPAWLKRKAEQEEAAKKIAERLQEGRSGA